MDLPSRISCLFGTKEYVGLRRQLVMLRKKLMNHSCLMEKPEIYNICSGSLGEGVDFPKSDDDLMFCQTNIRVVKTNREATERGDVLIMPSENSPGYCLLLDVRASC
ncbi:hypothetical protein FSP39_008760 [Pinctada imbricata]|uniref:Uncharacterized protein n=1 Tax=Pinctada imbricata TaxID=66713 RepID=A0AA88XVZ4_PINIB|nr:hypothetical protein FSP39_008760 [Pinctada imbricata]